MPKSSPVVPFGDWEPDRGIFGGADIAKGVLSQTKRYVPLPDLMPIRQGARLNDACIGGMGCYSTAGVANAFLGDVSRLYRVLDGDPVDVSKPGGYAADVDWVWKFEQFGDNVIAVARGVPPQVFRLGSSARFTDLANAPLGDTVFRVRQQLFLCDGITVNVSGFNDSTAWQPNAATQAFQNTVNQNNGLIQTGWGGEQGAIFQERGIVRLTYQGGAAPFIFDEVEGGRGACSPHSVAPWGRVAFVVAEDGFYLFDGLQVTPIGQDKVDRYFINRLNYSYRYKVWSAIDARRKCWMVAYPSGGATVCNSLLIYSWSDSRWTYDEVDTQFGFEYPKQGLSADDAGAITSLFGTASSDAIDQSVDSAIWRESRKEWAVVNGARTLCQFRGANRAATLGTSTFEPAPGSKSYISEFAPMIDAEPATMTGTIQTRLRRLDETPLIADTAVVNEEGCCEVRAEARYLSAHIDIAAGARWTEATGIRVDLQPTGKR